MAVEHSEPFGLLQLHQHWGRVGGSSEHSACVLVTAAKQALDSLQVLEVRPSPDRRALALSCTRRQLNVKESVARCMTSCKRACVLATAAKQAMDRLPSARAAPMVPPLPVV
jgi:hypothetical protein